MFGFHGFICVTIHSSVLAKIESILWTNALYLRSMVIKGSSDEMIGSISAKTLDSSNLRFGEKLKFPFKSVGYVVVLNVVFC